MLKNVLTYCLLIGIGNILLAQMPSTDLYLFDLGGDKDSIYLSNPLFLNHFNKSGYNNQPSFINDDLYITSNAYEEEKPEIIRLNISKSEITRMTKTVESEFSPTLMPDGKHLSCIRIERDGKDQSFWKYPLDRSGSGERMLKKLDNVGYHTWMDKNTVALFVVDNPVKLVIANVETGETRYMLDNIGRCLRTTSKGELIIVHKLLPEKWYLKMYDSTRGTFKILTETPVGAQDFVLLDDDSILMGSGSQLLHYKNKRITDRWHIVDDLGDLGIQNITRMAAKSGKLVITNNNN